LKREPTSAPRRRLAIDADGNAAPARRIRSPNQDARPPGMPITLIVVHGISLPPGEFGGEGIVQLFTNRLDASGTPTTRRSPRCACPPIS
jgi:AmpD protein